MIAVAIINIFNWSSPYKCSSQVLLMSYIWQYDCSHNIINSLYIVDLLWRLSFESKFGFCNTYNQLKKLLFFPLKINIQFVWSERETAAVWAGKMAWKEVQKSTWRTVDAHTHPSFFNIPSESTNVTQPHACRAHATNWPSDMEQKPFLATFSLDLYWGASW